MRFPQTHEGDDIRAELLSNLPECPFMATNALITLMHAGRLPMACSLGHKRCHSQSTPLFAASIIDRSDLLPMLISAVSLARGCRSGHVNEMSGGMTALHGAARFGCMKSARVLLALGADVNAPTEDGGTSPLHAAAMEGNLRMVRLLLDSGAKVNKVGEHAWNSPLYVASMCEHMFNTLPQFLEVTTVLLDAGAEVDPAQVETPLACAVTRRDHSMMTLLLDRGARVDLAQTSLVECDCKILNRFIAERARGDAHAPAHMPVQMSARARERACTALCRSGMVMEEAARMRSEARCVRRRNKERDACNDNNIDGKGQQYVSSLSSSCSPSSAPISIPIPKARLSPAARTSESDEIWDDDCVVCVGHKGHRRKCMMLPCSHMVMCMPCAEELLSRCTALHTHACCPICCVPTTCLVEMSR